MRESHHVMLGLFVLVGATLLIGGIAVVGGRRLITQGIVMETVFAESVQGLEVGSPVRFRGVRIGEVDEITFANRYYETQYRYALVRVNIEESAFREPGTIPEQVAQLIRDGLRVQLSAQGLTGVMYLETDLFARKEQPTLPIDWTPRFLYVPSTPSTLRQLGDSLTTTLDELASMPLRDLVQEMRDTLKQVRDEIGEMQFAERSREFGELLARGRGELERLGPEFDRLLGDLRQAAQKADQLIDSSKAKLDALELQPTVAELREFAVEARAAVTRLDAALRQADAFVADQRRGGSGLLENLREIAANLGRLTTTLERYPSLLLLGDPPKKDR